MRSDKRENKMKIIKENEKYKLVETKEIEYLGNYQVIRKNIYEPPFIFDDYNDALIKFNKLEKEL